MSVRASAFLFVLIAAALGGCQTRGSAQPVVGGSSEVSTRNVLDGVRPNNKRTTYTYRPFADQTYRLTTVNDRKVTDLVLTINATAAAGRIVITVIEPKDKLRVLMEPNGQIIDFVSAGSSRDSKGRDSEDALRMLIPEFVAGGVASGDPITRAELRSSTAAYPVLGILRGDKEINGTVYGLVTFHVVNPKTNELAVDLGYSLIDADTHFPAYTEYKFDKVLIVFTRN
ncbi:hypothetical protein HL658_31690 [Azospirillum sp. RWY-5-1]|uniref:Lipoprotein n=1 Tax=Azospirillum oleiclasticum TaxID=2735135 RepID=A0ABX2TJQ8_9PROT|nr:hypothetical protein [Azospirillum oleiclasticum]NYZ17130.1 hypothetical protein [Azospirillum oleiclasticum]NYZ24267.1 hypothetical protein [Azospirillum oleiclasticum]